MDAKTKRNLIWSALIVAAVVIAAFQWDLFSPKDYEDCTERAARNARSKEALSVLVSSCRSKFSGRRRPGGGYRYYDDRQERNFDIEGPNPNAHEMQYIEKQYSIYLEDQRQAVIAKADRERRMQEAQAQRERRMQEAQTQLDIRRETAKAELEIRRQAAVKLVGVSSNIECKLSSCVLYKLTVTVKNYSKENISSLSLGWAFISAQGSSCPTSLPSRHREQVILRPGDTTVLNIDGYDGPSTQFQYCVLVTDLNIAP